MRRFIQGRAKISNAKQRTSPEETSSHQTPRQVCWRFRKCEPHAGCERPSRRAGIAFITDLRQFLCEVSKMHRSKWGAVLLAIAFPLLSFGAQNGSDPIVAYFTGKQVVIKVDMPGTQKGIDLRYNNPTPMNWKEYSSRLKQNGAAIRKGDVARITSIVVKKDMIEFQLDGGGFGTFGDDTNTTVAAKVVPKSDYEKSLEQQIANTDDPDKKAQLQRDLHRERARRERQDAINQSAAQVASQIKAQQVADKRLSGGSRFNLRWSKSIPENELSPEAIMQLLADYVDFGGLQSGAAAPSAAPASELAP